MIALLKQAVPGLETAHCEKAARAPAKTVYGHERPRNAIVRWRAKSEGKLKPTKSSKASVARADQPAKRNKPTTFGAEPDNPKRQKSIAGMSLHTSKSDTSNDDEDDEDDASTRDETEDEDGEDSLNESSHDDD